MVSRLCGLSRVTITKGINELSGPALPAERIRRSGGGRLQLVVRDPRLLGVLESLVEPLTRDDPESPLRWTCKSTRTLAHELTGRQHPISHEKVAQLLQGMDYSLQGNRKTEEGEDHPDRDAQFRHINSEVRRALAQGRPGRSGWRVVPTPISESLIISGVTSRMQKESGGLKYRVQALTKLTPMTTLTTLTCPELRTSRGLLRATLRFSLLRRHPLALGVVRAAREARWQASLKIARAQLYIPPGISQVR